MKDISDAVDLMTTAREVLLRDLLPTLPKNRRYAGLMIANDMAIGLREQTSGMTAARGEITRLRKLLRCCPKRNRARTRWRTRIRKRRFRGFEARCARPSAPAASTTAHKSPR